MVKFSIYWNRRVFVISGIAVDHKNSTKEAVLTSTHNLCFEQKYENYLNFSSESFHFFGGKIFNIFRVLVMSGIAVDHKTSTEDVPEEPKSQI